MPDIDERHRLSCWLGEHAGRQDVSLGESRFWAGDLDGALKAFDEELLLDPDDAWALLSRAAVRYRRGELDLSRRDFEEFRRRRPEIGRAHV